MHPKTKPDVIPSFLTALRAAFHAAERKIGSSERAEIRPPTMENGSKGVPGGYPKVFRSREPRPTKPLGQNPEIRKIASRPTGPDNAKMIGPNLAEMAGFGCAKGVQRV